MSNQNFTRLKRFQNYVNGSIIKKQQLSDLVLYVRPDGNDENDGEANTASRAFASLKGAFDYLNLVEGNGHKLYIYVAAGDYPESSASSRNLTGWDEVHIYGDKLDSSNVTLNIPANGYGIEIVGARTTYMYITGFTFKGANTSTPIGVRLDNCTGYIEFCDESYVGEITLNTLRNGFAITNCPGAVEIYGDLILAGALGQCIVQIIAGSNVGIYCDDIIINFAQDFSASYRASVIGYAASVMYFYPTTVTATQTITGHQYISYGRTFVQKSSGWANMGTTIRCDVGSTDDGMFVTGTYTVAQLAAKSPNAGYMAWCTNDDGGACLAVYNGSNWARVDDQSHTLAAA